MIRTHFSWEIQSNTLLLYKYIIVKSKNILSLEAYQCLYCYLSKQTKYIIYIEYTCTATHMLIVCNATAHVPLTDKACMSNLMGQV